MLCPTWKPMYLRNPTESLLSDANSIILKTHIEVWGKEETYIYKINFSSENKSKRVGECDRIKFNVGN
jgi:hypothetical protein